MFRFAHPPNRRLSKNGLQRAARSSEEADEGRIHRWLELAERAFGNEDRAATAAQAREETVRQSGFYFLLSLANPGPDGEQND
jgi:hypothetical protein